MNNLYLFLISLALITGCESTMPESYDSAPIPVVSYNLPTECYVKLTLENSYNTIVSVLVDSRQATGSYNINIDTDGIQEGIYFYTLTAKGVNDNSYFETTQRMILIRK